MVPPAMDIHVEARWRDGDMQGGDTLACACLLDLPPLPRKRNGIPMFPRRDLCARVNPKATSRDRSGRGSGLCQVWFLSKRGGSVATPLVPPPTPICSGILMRGQQIEKWLRLSLRLSKITKPLCGLNVNQNGSYKHHQLRCLGDL